MDRVKEAGRPKLGSSASEAGAPPAAARGSSHWILATRRNVSWNHVYILLTKPPRMGGHNEATLKSEHTAGDLMDQFELYISLGEGLANSLERTGSILDRPYEHY
jgi:hypothetical protein